MNRKDLIEKIIENISVIRRRLSSVSGHDLSKCGITHYQAHALHFIEKSGSVSSKQIAESMDISPSATTQLIDELVEKGFVVRQDSEIDRRVSVIKLAENSATHIREQRQKMIQNITGMFDNLDSEDLSKLHSLINKIIIKEDK